MLVDFSFSNHRSYRDAQQFSMSFIHNDTDVSGEWQHPEISTVAAIYGANASGKSAFLDALMFIPRMLDRGLDLRRKHVGTGRTPFLLDAESVRESSDYLYEFIARDDKKYLYEVSVDDSTVLYESLRIYTRGNYTAKLFERLLSDEGGSDITYGRLFTGQKRVAESQLRSDRLFLGVAGSSGLKPVLAAFEELLSVGMYPASAFASELHRIADDLQASPARMAALSLLLDASSLGIKSIKADLKIREIIENLRDDSSADGALLYRNILRGLSYITMPELTEDERETSYEELSSILLKQSDAPLLFLHEGVDGSEAYLDEQSESRGTQAALAFLSLSLDKLSKRTVTLVDEVDTSLHPTYVEQLIGLFSDPSTNPYQSQLIFTTHDLSLITRAGADERPLSRDQVWIASKESDGRSTLYPVTSFRDVRREENLGRNYLHGVYGGLPNPLLKEAFTEAIRLVKESEGD